MDVDWKDLYAKKCAQFDLLMVSYEEHQTLVSKLLSLHESWKVEEREGYFMPETEADGQGNQIARLRTGACMRQLGKILFTDQSKWTPSS